MSDYKNIKRTKSKDEKFYSPEKTHYNQEHSQTFYDTLDIPHKADQKERPTFPYNMNISKITANSNKAHCLSLYEKGLKYKEEHQKFIDMGQSIKEKKEEDTKYAAPKQVKVEDFNLVLNRFQTNKQLNTEYKEKLREKHDQQIMKEVTARPQISTKSLKLAQKARERKKNQEKVEDVTNQFNPTKNGIAKDSGIKSHRSNYTSSTKNRDDMDSLDGFKSPQTRLHNSSDSKRDRDPMSTPVSKSSVPKLKLKLSNEKSNGKSENNHNNSDKNDLSHRVSLLTERISNVNYRKGPSQYVVTQAMEYMSGTNQSYSESKKIKELNNKQLIKYFRNTYWTYLNETVYHRLSKANPETPAEDQKHDKSAFNYISYSEYLDVLTKLKFISDDDFDYTVTQQADRLYYLICEKYWPYYTIEGDRESFYSADPDHEDISEQHGDISNRSGDIRNNNFKDLSEKSKEYSHLDTELLLYALLVVLYGYKPETFGLSEAQQKSLKSVETIQKQHFFDAFIENRRSRLSKREDGYGSYTFQPQINNSKYKHKQEGDKLIYAGVMIEEASTHHDVMLNWTKALHQKQDQERNELKKEQEESWKGLMQDKPTIHKVPASNKSNNESRVNTNARPSIINNFNAETFAKNLIYEIANEVPFLSKNHQLAEKHREKQEQVRKEKYLVEFCKTNGYQINNGKNYLKEMEWEMIKEEVEYLENIISLYKQDKLTHISKYKNALNSILNKYTQAGLLLMDQDGHLVYTQRWIDLKKKQETVATKSGFKVEKGEYISKLIRDIESKYGNANIV